MFTGDRSGEYLYRSLYRAGFASQPESLRADDGLELRDAWITASAHCAPPDNKPEPAELLNCRPWFTKELKLLKGLQIVVTLGGIGHKTYLEAVGQRPGSFPFGHNVLFDLQPPVLSSYHPSQQNTSTGRLTQEMLDEVFQRAAALIRSSAVPFA
ncbi:MAG: Uracil-DNA glycosylase superfamily [Bryobacterales bacterium]|nr:Uracil-DNA glycosylase superfamily [Bryobacterales bacterium]